MGVSFVLEMISVSIAVRFLLCVYLNIYCVLTCFYVIILTLITAKTTTTIICAAISRAETQKLNYSDFKVVKSKSVSWFLYFSTGYADYISTCLHKKNQFLPRCMECSRGIAMGILSVRLSVRPSVRLSVRQTRGLWQNRRKLCLDFYILWKNIYPSFLERRMVGGERPLLPEILGQPARVGAKSPILNW